ncbi:MAG: hypothetical protein ACLTGM_10000 [Oscillospiraceae bacterium]
MKTVIVIDNVLDTISALQGNLTGTVSTVEKGVYTFENEWFYLFCRLTITLSSSTNTRLFNDYNGTGSRNPHKTHKTAAELFCSGVHLCAETAEKPYFKRFSGIEKVHRNSIRITVDLC